MEFADKYATLAAEIKQLRERIAELEREIAGDAIFCDVKGCENESSNQGNAWRDAGYWCVCFDHSNAARNGAAMPQMKAEAIVREASRDERGFLPT